MIRIIFLIIIGILSLIAGKNGVEHVVTNILLASILAIIVLNKSNE